MNVLTSGPDAQTDEVDELEKLLSNQNSHIRHIR